MINKAFVVNDNGVIEVVDLQEWMKTDEIVIDGRLYLRHSLVNGTLALCTWTSPCTIVVHSPPGTVQQTIVLDKALGDGLCTSMGESGNVIAVGMSSGL